MSDNMPYTADDIAIAKANAAIGAAWNWFRDLIGRVSTTGWRPMFCWMAMIITAWANKIAYVDLPAQNIVLPGAYYNSLLLFTFVMLLTMGLRGAEKFAEKWLDRG